MVQTRLARYDATMQSQFTTSDQSPNAVIAQSGGPTAVINQSLIGCIEGLRNARGIGRVFGARHAVRGMIEDRFIDLTDIDQSTLDAVAATPSASLGSSRDKPDAAYCQKIVESLIEKNIRYFFYIGGNDSSDTCRLVHEHAQDAGFDLRAFHIPKTIDNDLQCNDHTPGYGSAARFVATAFMGDNLDNAAIPGIKVNVIMGRHAGFLAASAALARHNDDDGPHLIYMPERVFDPEEFVNDVDSVYARIGRCQIAVSEGIQDRAGNAISAVMSQNKEVDAHGNIQLAGTGALGDFLAERLRSDLSKGGSKVRVRADTFGYLQRCWPNASPIDQQEARRVGHEAAHLADEGHASCSMTIERVANDPYSAEIKTAKLEEVAGKTRHMPDEFIHESGHDVTDAFLRYARPLVGTLPRMVGF